MIETNFIDTEIGCVPADWMVVSLGEIGEVRMCKRVMKYQTSEKGEIPFFKIGTFGKTPDAYISRELYSSYKEKYNYPKKGDILLSAAGTIGRTVVFDGKPSYFQDSNIVWIENDEKKVYNELLFYIYKNLSWVTESGTIPRIYNGIVRSIVFAIPSSLPEQRHIASALSSIDNLISALDKLIEKKCAIKTGAMQELLGGKRRVKGCEGEWKRMRLGEGLIFQCGAPFESSYFNTESIGMRLIKNRDLKSDDQVYFYSGEYSDEYIVRNGDLLVGMDGDFLPCIWNKGEALLNQRVGRIKSDIWSIPFLYYILMEPLKIKQAGTGATTVKHLSHGDIESMSILLPSSLEEQRAIASVLTAMDDELTALEAKKAKYVALKQGMMQQLLTGKIRLIESSAK